jgi:hypothetical protein
LQTGASKQDSKKFPSQFHLLFAFKSIELFI